MSPEVLSLDDKKSRSRLSTLDFDRYVGLWQGFLGQCAVPFNDRQAGQWAKKTGLCPLSLAIHGFALLSVNSLERREKAQ
jgi:hypothetical protein